MATITTTTSDAVTDPGQGRTDVQSDGTMWHMVRRTSGAIGFFYSKNNGTTWIDSGAGNDVAASGNIEISNLYIDQGNFASWCYRTYSSGADRIFYVYGRPTSGNTAWSWYTTVQLMSVTGAAAGNGCQKMDVCTIFNPYPANTGPALVFLAVSGGTDQPWVMRVGWWTNNYGVMVNKALVNLDTLSSVPNMPSVDFRHTGGDKYRVTPPEFLVVSGSGWTSAGATGRYQQFRFLWNGSTFVQSSLQINGAVGATDGDLGGAPTGQLRRVVRIDAQGRALIPHINGTDVMAVLEIDPSRTKKTVRIPPAHPTGIVTAATLVYDTNGNIYLYAVGTSTNQVYKCTYTRTGDTWGGWTAVGSATSDNASWGVRRNAENNRLDSWTQTGSGTFTISNQQVGVSVSPVNPRWQSAPILSTNAGSAIVTGGIVANVASSLPLDWDFIDPDPTDVQSAYAVSRQIGAGTIQYWRASDSTWQAAEVKNISATSLITLASGWGADSDANHTYKVKVWDSTDLPSVYSDGLLIVPSAVSNPTITAPTNGGTVTSALSTLTWTVSQQTKYRVLLERNVSSSWVQILDQTISNASDRSFNMDGLVNGGSYRVTLYTSNTEGLWTAGTTNTFTVTYTPPNTPTLAFTSLGAMFDYIIHGTITNPGGGITVTANRVERRESGDDTTIIVLRTDVPVGGTFDDAQVRSDVAYEYRVTALGSNGAQAVTSWIS